SDLNKIDTFYKVDLDERSSISIKERYPNSEIISSLYFHFLPHSLLCLIENNDTKIYSIVKELIKCQRNPHTILNKFSDDILLSKDEISYINDVIGDFLNIESILDEISNKDDAKNLDEKLYSFRKYLAKLRSLGAEKQELIETRFRNCGDLYERIYKAMNLKLAKSKKRLVQMRIPPSFSISLQYLLDFFPNFIQYLGPLRVAPKPLYTVVPATSLNGLGLAGENTASVLDQFKGKTISYIPSDSFKSSIILPDRKKAPLLNAVTDWLQYLGVASSVLSKVQGKYGHRLTVELADASFNHDLTHVGVGVSQVLPILVMCLLAEPDSTLILEQPELHLHPKVQSKLADFFLSISLCDKQCIVETHSAYLIDSLRYRIAANSSDIDLNNAIKIYFAEKIQGNTSFREVEINEYGAIKDWPEGFFDESGEQAEKILRAAINKRKTRMVKKDV
ncbi:MAG: DUF3696 domain-containing protein, partial [Rickettsiales bacterium]|nr:DUF3696 domain-containing protein [Rickettsiales bacterium]